MFHVHNSRICWDCGREAIVPNAISIKVANAGLISIGWQELEPHGRMVCFECARKRREAARKEKEALVQLDMEDLPF